MLTVETISPLAHVLNEKKGKKNYRSLGSLKIDLDK